MGARSWDGWEIGSKASARIGNRQAANGDIYARTFVGFRAKDPSLRTDDQLLSPSVEPAILADARFRGAV